MDVSRPRHLKGGKLIPIAIGRSSDSFQVEEPGTPLGARKRGEGHPPRTTVRVAPFRVAAIS